MSSVFKLLLGKISGRLFFVNVSLAILGIFIVLLTAGEEVTSNSVDDVFSKPPCHEEDAVLKQQREAVIDCWVDCFLNCTNFEKEFCHGNCSEVLQSTSSRCLTSNGFTSNGFTTNDDSLIPENLTLHQLDPYSLLLTWNPVNTSSQGEISYIVESYKSTGPWQKIAVTDDTSHRCSLGVCDHIFFRVFSVTDRGKSEASSNISREEPVSPGVITNVSQHGQAYYKDEYFYSLKSFYPPYGWRSEDIQHYVAAQSEHSKNCTNNNPMPPNAHVKFIQGDGYQMFIEVSAHQTGEGCVFYFDVQAVSTCYIEGAVYDLEVNFTDCREIVDYVNCSLPTTPAPPPNTTPTPKTPDVVDVQVTVDFPDVNLTWNLTSEAGVACQKLVWGPTKGYPLVLEEEDRVRVEQNVREATFNVTELGKLYGLKIYPVMEKYKDKNDHIDFMLMYMPITFRFVSSRMDGPVFSTINPIIRPRTSQPPYVSQGRATWVYAVAGIMTFLLVGAGVVVWFVKMQRKNSKKSMGDIQLQSLGSKHHVPMVDNTLYEDYRNILLSLHEGSGDADWELSWSYVTVTSVLGRGAFGQVVKAQLNTDNWTVVKNQSGQLQCITVAVKVLLDYASPSQKDEFRREIELMKTMKPHQNLVCMLGCITSEEPLALIEEFVALGDLRHYLTTHRPPAPTALTMQELVFFSWQVAQGMDFLSECGFVHRDLACRNILVATRQLVKIADFGLTRCVYNDKMYVTRKGFKLPLKWMAPESVERLTFTSSSDVWSYGITLFEIFSYGEVPFATIDNCILIPKLRAGFQLRRPQDCPEVIYSVMRSCWSLDPDLRPTFSELSLQMEHVYNTGDTINFPTYISIASTSASQQSTSTSQGLTSTSQGLTSTSRESTSYSMDMPEHTPSPAEFEFTQLECRSPWEAMLAEDTGQQQFSACSLDRLLEKTTKHKDKLSSSSS